MPDSAETDPTQQYAALLGTDERVLEVRRRHLFSLVEGARWFFAAIGIAKILDAKYQHELEVGGGRAAAAAPVAAPAAPAPERMTAQEVDDAVTRLAAMRDRGVITAGEFEDKKRDLLDRI